MNDRPTYTVTILSVDDEGNEEKTIRTLSREVDRIEVYIPNIKNPYFVMIEPPPTKYVAEWFETWLSSRITAKSKDKATEVAKQYRDNNLGETVINKVHIDRMKRFVERDTPLFVVEDNRSRKIIPDIKALIPDVELTPAEIIAELTNAINQNAKAEALKLVSKLSDWIDNHEGE